MITYIQTSTSCEEFTIRRMRSTSDLMGNSPSQPHFECSGGDLQVVGVSVIKPSWREHGMYACCAAICNVCGGQICSSRPGGREQCCVEVIIKSNRSCITSAPPCHMKRPRLSTRQKDHSATDAKLQSQPLKRPESAQRLPRILAALA